MKGDHKGDRGMSKRRVRFLLPLIAIAAMLAASTVHAGCMDGKLTCSINYLYNDTKNMLLKSAKIDYSAVVSPSVTTRVECSEVSDGTTDLSCSSKALYAYIYYIRTNATTRIQNPGYLQTRDLCEKICGEMGVAVYYMNGGPL